MGCDVNGIALVETGKLGQQLFSVGQVLVGTQHGLCEAGALHLQQLVDQHIPSGTDVAPEAQAAAQQEGLTERTAIAELGKVQIHTVNAIQVQLSGVGIICQADGFFC